MKELTIKQILSNPSMVMVFDAENERTEFAFCCQVCEKPITDRDLGMVVAYSPTQGRSPIVEHQPGIVVHKENCNQGVELVFGLWQTGPWVSLDGFCFEALSYAGVSMEIQGSHRIVHAPAFELDEDGLW